MNKGGSEFMKILSAIGVGLLWFISSQLTSAQSLTGDCPEGTLFSQSLNGQVECLPVKRSSSASTPSPITGGPLVEAVGRMDATQSAPGPVDFDKGFWDHRSYGKGQFCTAAFFKESASVSIVGPGGNQTGALMIFASATVPRPNDPVVETKVTLRQSDSPPQTVKTFHVQNPHAKESGAIVFAVPTIEAALEGMIDTLDFDVILNGKSVVAIGWYDGLDAKQKLRKCLKTVR